MRFVLVGLVVTASGCAFPTSSHQNACAVATGLDATLCRALDGAAVASPPPPAPFDRAIALAATTDAERALPYGYDLAFDVDLAALEAALARAHVAPPIAADFAARVRSRRDALVAAVESRSAHWHAVFVGPAIATREHWNAGNPRRAAWRGRADPMIASAAAGATDPALRDALFALRVAYVDDCTHAGEDPAWCVSDEVGGRLTDAILHVARASHDDVLQNAEARLYELPNRTTLRDAIYDAAHGAALDEHGRATAGKPGAIDTLGYQVAGRDPANRREPHVAVASDALVRIQLDRVERHGDRATLFARKYVAVSNDRADGRGPASWLREDHTAKPIDVPWIDARALKPTEVISAMIDRATRRGYIAAVHTDAHPQVVFGERAGEDPGAASLVQVRSFRLTSRR